MAVEYTLGQASARRASVRYARTSAPLADNSLQNPEEVLPASATTAPTVRFPGGFRQPSCPWNPVRNAPAHTDLA